MNISHKTSTSFPFSSCMREFLRYFRNSATNRTIQRLTGCSRDVWFFTTLPLLPPPHSTPRRSNIWQHLGKAEDWQLTKVPSRVVDPNWFQCGSGSSTNVNADPDPRFWWPKNFKVLQLEKKYYFWNKNCNYLSLAIMKDVKATLEAEPWAKAKGLIRPAVPNQRCKIGPVY